MKLFSSSKFLLEKLQALKSNERWFLALLIVLPIIWWWPLWTGFLPGHMDTVVLQFPLKIAAAHQIHSGTIPLWLPEIMSGMPLMANPESNIWYPPNYLFLAIPSVITYGMIIVFHYIISGLGVYFFCRYQKYVPAACFVAALSFQFSSFMIGHIALLPHVYFTAWIPFLLLAVEWDVRQKSGKILTPAIPVIIILYTMMILTGAPQMLYYFSLALPIYWVVRGVQLNSYHYILTVFARGFLTALLAIMISSVQLLSTLDTLSSTERSGALSVEKLQNTALNGGYLWRSLVGFTGKDLEDVDSVNAIGIGLILLIPLALLRKKNRNLSILIICIGLFSYLLSVGALVKIWKSILPMYGSFHAPRRALFLWSVLGPLIIGAGLHEFILRAKILKLNSKIVYLIIAVLFIPNIFMLTRLERKFVTAEQYTPPSEVISHLQTGERFFTIDPTMNYSYGSRAENFGNSLIPNLAASHHVSDVQGYNSFVLERYGIARRMASMESGVFYPSHGAFFTNPNSRILKLMNVRYLIGRYDLFDPGRVIPNASIDVEGVEKKVSLLYDDQQWPLWEYKNPGPFAWLPTQVIFSDTPEQAIARIVNIENMYQVASFDFESDADLYVQNNAVRDNSLAIESIEKKSARAIKVRLNKPISDQERILIASISWKNGWVGKASNGEKLQTFPVNGFNTAVLIPKGCDSVELIYSPKSFWNGLGFSICGLLIFIYLTVRIYRRKLNES